MYSLILYMLLGAFLGANGINIIDTPLQTITIFVIVGAIDVLSKRGIQ